MKQTGQDYKTHQMEKAISACIRKETLLYYNNVEQVDVHV